MKREPFSQRTCPRCEMELELSVPGVPGMHVDFSAPIVMMCPECNSRGAPDEMIPTNETRAMGPEIVDADRAAFFQATEALRNGQALELERMPGANAMLAGVLLRIVNTDEYPAATKPYALRSVASLRGFELPHFLKVDKGRG